MNSMIDLHIHSSYSDGDYLIEEIILLLKKYNIKTFSIADHDNINSYYKIKKLKIKNLNYISGVELSTYHNNYCFHILGYNYHDNIKPLEDIINVINNKRIIRATEMIKSIEHNHDLKFSEKEVKKVLDHPSVGKKHVAKMMIKNNIGDSYSEILMDFMTGLHLPTSYRVSVKSACEAIKLSNGIPVLAHPKEYEIRYNLRIEDVIEELISDGIMGIEVYHSIHNNNDVIRYKALARRYNLLITGGSDFHGESKNNIKLGIMINDEKELKDISIIDYINA